MRTVLFCLLCCFFSAGVLAGKTTEQVLLKTSEGDIVLELNAAAAPTSCKNFLHYVDTGFYNNTVFHRVIPSFMVQGGGFETGMKEKPTQPPIRNESANGLKNARGSIAMARTAQPDSATAQFFINLVNNTYLNGSATTPGYAVFGKVISGMEVVDRIAAARTANSGMFQDVPVKDILILNASRITTAAQPTSTQPTSTQPAP